jgi:hypothetical protein
MLANEHITEGAASIAFETGINACTPYRFLPRRVEINQRATS